MGSPKPNLKSMGSAKAALKTRDLVVRKYMKSEDLKVKYREKGMWVWGYGGMGCLVSGGEGIYLLMYV